MLARHHDPIVAIATAPGRGAVGIVRVSGQPARRPCAPPARARSAAARGHLPALPRRPGRSPWTTAWRCTSPARTATPAKTCWSCRPTAAPWCCSCCWRAAWRRRKSAGRRRPARGPARPAPGPARRVHRARLLERQDRPGPGRGHCRPDRRQHRRCGAQRQPLAVGRLLARNHQLRDALIHLRMLVEATLDFPEEEIDFLQKADAWGQLDAPARPAGPGAAPAPSRARCCAKASRW